MDLDTTRTRNAYERIISDFSSQKTNLLIGTQMVTKGLDFDQYIKDVVPYIQLGLFDSAIKKIKTIERNRIIFGKEYIPISDSYKDSFQAFLNKYSIL